MNGIEYPARVTLYEDGVFRWFYDMDMWRNRYMLRLLVRVLSVILLIPVAFFLLTVLNRALPPLLDGTPWRRVAFMIHDDLKVLGLVALICVGILLLALLIYAVCALVMKGNYRLYFEMDETAVTLVRSAGSMNAINALGVAATVAALAAGKPGGALRTGAMLAGANAVGTTRFDSVRRVKRYPQYDLIDLREWFGMNQIYVSGEDYPFVRDFILERVREKARR